VDVSKEADHGFLPTLQSYPSPDGRTTNLTEAEIVARAPWRPGFLLDNPGEVG
jgi:hypothetical protein